MELGLDRFLEGSHPCSGARIERVPDLRGYEEAGYISGVQGYSTYCAV